MPFWRRDEVDRDWRRQLTVLPFRARQSSRNGPVRLGQRFSEDRRRAWLVVARRGASEAALRELATRNKVYPRWITEGKITEGTTNHRRHCISETIRILDEL